ncbi:MAG: sigma-54-dependent Fis family transcriptional regulator [Acidobacteriota bacterium]|nr:sigma-54-dependent Fis family transcriptional regulator [Acidobacteriota bacterium]
MKFTGEELPTGFIGRSPRIVQIREQIEKVGASRTPVLIQGESGTGKEVAARSLYNTYPRGQFVPIDCGSLVGPLMESELFGHARHAFTGAGEAKKGLIEQANGGTAFFDEIGDLTLELQVKLLRVLQEREYRPVGSLQRYRVDIRIVAATHRDLAAEVRAGRFREDLFHRLNVIRLTLPPLRERKQDIPLLIERILANLDRRYVLTNEALEALLRYDWPGNIRELKNCLERMTALNSGPLLHFADLPTNVVNGVRAPAASVAAAAMVRQTAAPAQASGSSIIPLHELERQAIEHALRETRGDRTHAAHLLGIGRTTLYRKLKEYGISASY